MWRGSLSPEGLQSDVDDLSGRNRARVGDLVVAAGNGRVCFHGELMDSEGRVPICENRHGSTSPILGV